MRRKSAARCARIAIVDRFVAGFGRVRGATTIGTDMPNIGSVLKEEIVRLARKESRSQIDPTKKATIQQRREHAELKRRVAQLARQVALLSRKILGTRAIAPADDKGKPARFSVKGLRVQRERLGLSADDFGKLLGVSAQSIYNWEHEKARPRAEQISKVAALRGIGKREASARLDQIAAAKKTARPKS
jgi:DNA-binding XRE family transcriptional regulator